jgi:hypothetical protein
MARAGYRIFDADTHIIEPVEPIEAYLSAADKAASRGSASASAPSSIASSAPAIASRRPTRSPAA